MRTLGLTYHAHAVELVWFRRRPRWATSRLHGRIYSNSWGMVMAAGHLTELQCAILIRSRMAVVK